MVVLASCGFEHGAPAGHGPNDGGIDVPPVVGDPDAAPDADPGCFGQAPFVVCPAVQPAQPLDINSNITTSGTAPSCDNGRGVVMTVAGTESCVLAGTDITFSGSSTRGSSGSRPLVLIATGTITIDDGDTLDARAATVGPGPGSNPSDCGAPPNGMVSGGNGGGGAGGSFGSKGGNGANGGAATGSPANAAATTPVNKLRGGCPGGNGAGGTALGGNGGGAVLMIAKTKIQIDGTLTVSGAGGAGGKSSKGGAGGGGSGGMIVLHAPMVSLGTNARLMANGGGGGGGAGAGEDGLPGDDATTLATAAAGGGTNGAGTTAGGSGAFKATDAVTPANAGGGGGGAGGGGGVGVIRVLSGQTISDTNCSPAATN